MNSFLRKSFVLVMAVVLVLPMAFSFAAVEVRAEDPTSTKLTITASKSLEGRALKAGEFTFELTGTGIDAPMTATNDANGKIEFDEITYTSTGTYTYTIKEVVPADAENADGVKYSEANDDQKKVGGFAKDGITYDSREKVMVVTVDAGINITSVTLDGEKQDVKPSGTTGTSTGSLGDSVTVNAVLGEDIDGDGEPDYPQAYSYYQEGDTLVALRDGDTVFYCIDDDLLTPDVEGTYYSSTFEPADATDLNDAATIKTIKKLLYFGAPHDGGTNETPDWIIEEAKSLVNSYTYDLESAQNAFEFITSRLLHGVTNARQGHDTANTQTDILDVIIDRETGDYIGGAAERAESGSLTMFDLLSQRIWKKVVDSSTDYVADLVTLHFYTTDGPNRGEDIDSRQRIVTAEISQSASASVDLSEAFENEYKEEKFGKLTIKKKVEGENAPADAEFTFTVTLPEGEFSYKGSKEGKISNNGTITLKGGESVTIEGIPADATYSVTEGEPGENWTLKSKTGDSGTITADGEVTAEFTNTYTYTVETTSVTVTKEWKNIKAENAPEVSVQLKKNGTAEGEAVKLNASNNWTYTWDKLEKGPEYTVEELDVDKTKYDSVVTGSAAAGYKITNTNKETVEVKATKKWMDGATAVEAPAGATVTFQLKANGANCGDAVELTCTGKETAKTWTELPKYDETGEEIIYTVEETGFTGEDFTKGTVSGDMANGFVLTNTKNEVETTSIKVTKIWVDDNNKAGKRPESITVYLRADGGNTGKSVVLNEANNWTATFENIPLKEDGQEISYNILEFSSDDYEGTVEKKSDNEFVLTNTYKPEEEEKQETTEIKIIKHWDDMGDFEKKRPDSITITLYADGEKVETRVITDAEKDENGNWLSTFENLPKTNAAGKTIKYTVEEKAIDYYVTSIYNTSEGVFEVFNTSRPWIPRVPGTPGGYGKVIVKKTVSGAAESDKVFEFVAKVTYQNGDVTETKFKITAAGDPYTMDMIPEGAIVEITEKTPEGYTAKYTIGADECNTVTVEKNSETTITVNNDKPAAPEKPDGTKPAANTGDDSNMMLWLAICTAAGFAALTSKKLRRR